MPEIPIPSRLGNFEVLDIIGVGLSGEVYKARYHDGTMVALKVLARRHQKNPTVFGYFTNEQTLLRELLEYRRHPHIVEYITSNFNRQPFYLATRLIEGARGLQDVLGDQPFSLGGKPQPASFVVRVISQIASALDYIHAGHPTYSPIIHRDVKPANILIDAEENAVLIDFSIASHPHYALIDEKVLGTPGYMAPEQYEGKEVPASDQFALAVIALHMLTGRRPLPSSATASLKQIERWRDTKHEEIERLLESRTHTTDVLRRALAYDPNDRYASCEEFADQLRRALAQDGEEVRATPPSRVPASAHSPGVISSPKKTPLPAKPMLAWIAIGMVALIALVILIIAATSPITDARTLPVAPPQPSVVAPMVTPPASIATPALPQATLAPVVTQSTLVPAQIADSVTMLRREPLRARPSTDSVILVWMPEGAQALRTGNQQQAGLLVWYEVQYEGRTGWCRNIYCTP